MAGARGILLDETEAIELALLKTEQIVASSQEARTLLRRLLAQAKGVAPSPSSRPRDNKPRRSHKPRVEDDEETQDTEETEDDASPNGRGALLHLPNTSDEPALTLDDIDDEGRYNVNQTALVLNRSAYTIRHWIKEDKMQAEREGRGKGQFFVSGSEIRRHAERN